MSRKLGGVRITPNQEALEKAIAGDIFKKEPIRNVAELEKVRDELAKNAPQYIRIFHALAVETGHRPGDLCEITWANVDFAAGALVDVRVNKQTQSATTKAITKHFKAAYEAEINRAKRRRDFDTLDHLEEIGLNGWKDEISLEEFNALNDEAAKIAASIPPKMQTNALPAELVNALKSFKDSLFDVQPDDFVFDSRVTNSPRAKSAAIVNGKSHVSRTTVWRHMRECIKSALQLDFTEVKQTLKSGAARLVKLLKYSLYSCRKTALWFVATTGGETIDDKAAMEFIGHSSPEMTKKYTRAGLKHALNEEMRPVIYAL